MKCVCCNQTIRAKDERASFVVGGQTLSACMPCNRADLLDVFRQFYTRHAPGDTLVKAPGATKKLARAHCQFVIDVGQTLARLGAIWDRRTFIRGYILNTPAGPLELDLCGNFIGGRFLSPYGGVCATKGQSNAHSGKWCFMVGRDDAGHLEALASSFAVDLEVMLMFQPTPEQQARIDAELQRERLRSTEFGRARTVWRERVLPSGRTELIRSYSYA